MKLSFYLLCIFCLISGLAGAQYCTPNVSNCLNYHTTRVQIANLSNNSACSPNGYTDYRGTIAAANVNAGSIVPIKFDLHTDFTSCLVMVGADFNGNFLFDSSEVFYFSGRDSAKGVLRIPYHANVGTTLLRVRTVSGTTSNANICSSYFSSEVEDYALNILPATTPGPDLNFYVNAASTGAGTGESWDNAFKTLAEATAIAYGGDTIRVAQGTYYPGTQSSSRFVLRDSVKLFGGFPGSGNPRMQDRDFSRFQTILSGRISTSVRASTVLSTPFSFDGPARNFAVDGVVIEAADGPAFTAYSSTGSIENSVLRLSGTAIAINGGNIRFINCYITDNYSTQANNYALSASDADITMQNCIFNGNTSRNYLIQFTNSRGYFDQSIFFNNDAFLSGGSLMNLRTNASINLRNSILYNNAVNDSVSHEEIQQQPGTSVSILNSITQVFPNPLPHLFKVNPHFRNEENVAGEDNFYFTSDDGLQVQSPCSPAINQGDNQFASGITKDAAGNPRILNGNADLGAFESVDNTPVSVMYVNATATGLNNGTSWVNAFTDLQSAIKNCADTVKIAAGTYVPSTTSRQHSFVLRSNQVWMGGYPTTGNPTNDMRDPLLHKTILSPKLTIGGSTEYSYDIVKGFIVDTTSILDGIQIGDPTPSSATSFTTTGVSLNNFSSPKFINCTFTENAYAFNVIDSSKPSFHNATIINNGYLGTFRNAGGTFNDCHFANNNDPNVTHDHFIASSITFVNSTFTSNPNLLIFRDSARLRMRGCHFTDNDRVIQIHDDASADVIQTTFTGSNRIQVERGSTSLFENCVFTNFGSAAGLFINRDASSLISKCVFENYTGFALNNYENGNLRVENSISSSRPPGGPVGGSFLRNDAAIATILNSSIVNGAISTGSFGILANYNGATTNVYNSIFSGHNLGTFAVGLFSGGGFNVYNSITQRYGTTGVDGNLVDVLPQFFNIENLKGADGNYFTADDGLRLTSCSPAVNTGNNSLLSGLATDILGGNRVVNGVVDMGAYESQGTASSARSIFVSTGATGLNDGTSWANAFTSLQEALLNPCGDTIRIARGTYYPALADRDSAFHINRKVVLLGGFPATGNPSDSQRDPDLYPAILNGDLGIRGDSSDNSYHLITINAEDYKVVIDGLTFKYAHANGADTVVRMFPRGKGAAINCYRADSLIVSNCRFSENRTGSQLISMYIDSYTQITKCVFERNFGSNLFLQLNSASHTINNTVFSRNTFSSGGCININASPVGPLRIWNCIFYRNSANDAGVGINMRGINTVEIANCDFIENNSNSVWEGISLYALNPQNAADYPRITNCNFYSQSYVGTPVNNAYADWVNYSGFGPDTWGLYVSNSSTISGGGYTWNNVSPNVIAYTNTEDPVGTDGRWFTADDGLKMNPCSGGINRGSNTEVLSTTDIAGNPRINESLVDLGAYEWHSGETSVSITASDTTFCAGNPVTFLVLASGFGDAPDYQWQVNGVNTGTNSTTFITSSLSNNDEIRCIVTSNASCTVQQADTSAVITVAVVSGVSPTASITASSNNICAGENILFSANITNGGSSPMYQWLVDGVAVAGAVTSQFTLNAPSNNTEVSVVVQSSLQCTLPPSDTSDIIVVNVNSLPVADAGVDTLVCAGSSIQLQASGGVLYSWQPAATLSDPTIANPVASPASTTQYTVEVSDGQCTSRDTVMISITPVQSLSVNLSPVSVRICAGETVPFQAIVTNGGSDPDFVWMINDVPVPGTNVPAFSIANASHNDRVKVEVNSNRQCLVNSTALSNEVIISVDSLGIPEVTLNADVLSVLNPDPGAIYAWQIKSGNTWMYVIPAATGTTYTLVAPGDYRVQATKGNCTEYSDGVTFARNASIVMYPNPATSIMFIRFADPSQWGDVQIFNAAGQPVSGRLAVGGASEIPVDVSTLNSGMYMIRISDINGGTAILRFVKI